MTNAAGRRGGSARRSGQSKPWSRDVYAALDLGTNNCRLLIARPAGRGFRVVDAFSRIVRLGEGLAQNGRLSEAAMNRTLEALRICARKMERWRVTRRRAVATEACRRARNCSIFTERVRREIGLDLEIITNSEEATLGLYGCTPLLDPTVPDALIFDIGGGSTEVSWLKIAAPEGGGAGRLVPALSDWCSIPMGVVTLAERYGGVDIAEGAYAAMVDDVAEALQPFDRKHGLSRRTRRGEVQMLGTSGTVTTLSGINKKLRRYDRARVDGSYLSYRAIASLSSRIATMSYEERVAHPCIGGERADLVVAGCAILEGICRTWPVDRLRVADRGLREGILFSLMDRRRCPAPSRPASALEVEIGE